MRATLEQAKSYQRRVKRHDPGPPLIRNLVTAFLTGGAICVVGQVILNGFLANGTPFEEAALFTSTMMIILGALLTGLGMYDEVVRWGGMGGALPITGFANSIVAPAMEYRDEGFVLGVGARLFSIAGPVIVYGTLIAIVSAGLRYGTVGP